MDFQTKSERRAMNLLIAVVILVQIVSFSEGKYSFSYADLDTCTEYDAKSGYGYHDFFHLVKFGNNGTTSETILSMDFTVLAAKDAHVLLSQYNHTLKNSRVIEIVIGAGANTFCEIRRQKSTQPLRTVRVKNILSPINPISFTLRISKSGFIDLKYMGNNESIVNATIPDIFPIEYVGFSSWGTTEAKFFFDCKGSNQLDKKSSPNQRTKLRQLRENLFQGDYYDETQPPANLSTIFWKFNLKYSEFDADAVQTTTYGSFNAKWTDARFTWDPARYDNISFVALQAFSSSYKVWVPQIRLLNGVKSDFTQLRLKFILMIYSNGEIIAHSEETSFVTWCEKYSKNWPKETIRCPIIMKFDDYTGLTFTESSLYTEFNSQPKFDGGKYRITRAKLYSQMSFSDVSFDYDEDELPISHDRLIFEMLMQQNDQFNARLFETPLAGAMSLILLSLWTESSTQLALNSIALIILSGMHILIADYGPHDYVPPLVFAYNCSLLVAMITTIVYIINCYQKENCADSEHIRVLSKALKKPWIRLLLGLDLFCTTSGSQELSVDSTNGDDYRKAINRSLFLALVLFFSAIQLNGYTSAE